MPKKAPAILQKACRSCKYIVEEDTAVCPSCGGTDFSTDWSGLVVILDPDTSEIAKILGVKRAGRYAIRVR